MKILQNNVLYVQNKDYLKLFNLNLSLSPTVYYEIFKDNLMVRIDKTNHQDFIEIKNKWIIDTFLSLDFIIDYNKIKDLPEQEIMIYRKQLTDKMHDIFNELYYNNFISIKEKQQLSLQYTLLEEEVRSLDEYIQFLNGNIQLLLPDGIGYPKFFSGTKLKKDKENLEYQKEKGSFRRILRKTSKILKNRKR